LIAHDAVLWYHATIQRRQQKTLDEIFQKPDRKDIDAMLRYRNYTGIVEYDPDGKIFTGEVIGVRDVTAFQGRTPEEIEQSFRASVEFYLEMCQQDGISPQKPFSGRFNVRLSPEVHRQIAEKKQRYSMSA
jgi:predicted HicB family RNase H-like nuclease